MVGWWFGVEILTTVAATMVANSSGVQVMVEASEDEEVTATAAANASGMVVMELSHGVPRLRAAMSSMVS